MENAVLHLAPGQWDPANMGVGFLLSLGCRGRELLCLGSFLALHSEITPDGAWVGTRPLMLEVDPA